AYEIGENVETNMKVSEGLAFFNEYKDFQTSNIDKLDLKTEPQRLNGVSYQIVDEESLEETKQILKQHLEILDTPSSLPDQEEGAEEEEGMTEAEENSETNEMIERDSPVELDEQQEQNEITQEVPHEKIAPKKRTTYSFIVRNTCFFYRFVISFDPSFSYR